MALTTVNSWKVLGGFVRKFLHHSSATQTEMKFSVYFPPQVGQGEKVPALYWLSGLTCTDDNFIQKAGVYKAAAAHGIAIICPDTSPRGAGCPNEADSWDFGVGAGFYVNATNPVYSKNYRMFDYITKELPSLVATHFPTSINADKKSISGHSMGGHGALIAFLKNPGLYKSVSAFAPICNPSHPSCAWGQKAFTGYFGAENSSEWRQWDATELIRQYNRKYQENMKNPNQEEKNTDYQKFLSSSSPAFPIPILIDQGSNDEFLGKSQLLPNHLLEAAKGVEEGKAGNSLFSIDYRSQLDYDHSYFFIQSFIEDHIQYHAKYLKLP